MPGLRIVMLRARGVAMIEFLIALLLFSLVMAGGLQVQLRALQLTRETLAWHAALSLLQSLVNHEAARGLSMVAPADINLAQLRDGDAFPGLASPSALGHLPQDARLLVQQSTIATEFALLWNDTSTAARRAPVAPMLSAIVIRP